MPIYEYQCLQCGKGFEVFSGARETTSPSCKFCSGPVKKLISVSSFHLKGSGWYVTDYARKGSAGSSDGKEEEKTKPAEKTEKTVTPPASTSTD